MSTTPSYKDLLAQREELERQIASARKAELATAVQSIRDLVSQFGLTAEDVFGGARKGTGPKATKGSTVAPKYRNPATGETWTGRGKAPKWIANQERTQYMIA